MSSSDQVSMNHGKESIDRFCDHLKSLREESGFTLQRASLETRISRPFLLSLENGSFDNLPGVVFGRGFIRTLCKIYQATESEKTLLEEFDLACKEMGLEEISLGSGPKDDSSTFTNSRHSSPIVFSKFIKRMNPAHYFHFGPMSLSIILVMVVLTIGSQLVDLGSLGTDSEDVTVRSVERGFVQKIDEAPEVHDILVQKSENKDLKEDSATSTQQFQKVVMNFPKASKVRVKVDKDPWKTQNTSESSYIWKFRNRVDFLLKDPEGVRIEYNGQTIGPLKSGLGYRRLSFANDTPNY